MNDEEKDLSADFLKSDSQIDNILIRLKQKEVDEQIRSNKVIEGLLRDIYFGIDRIGNDFDHKQIQERDIMNGNETTKPEQSNMDSLADIAAMLKEQKTELIFIANHIKLMNESHQLITAQLSEMNITLGNMSEKVFSLAEAEAQPEPDQPEQPEPEQPEQEPDVLPVHSITPPDRHTGQIALCGALGTPSQPCAARQNEPVTDNIEDVTCPECLEIIAKSRES